MRKDPDGKGPNKHFRCHALFAIPHPSKSSRMKAEPKIIRPISRMDGKTLRDKCSLVQQNLINSHPI